MACGLWPVRPILVWFRSLLGIGLYLLAASHLIFATSFIVGCSIWRRAHSCLTKNSFIDLLRSFVLEIGHILQPTTMNQYYDSQGKARPVVEAVPMGGQSYYPEQQQPYAPQSYYPQQPSIPQSGGYGQSDMIPPLTGGYNVQTTQPGVPIGNAALSGASRIPYTTPIDEVIPFVGCGIIQYSIYLTYPYIFGCACTQTTLCCTNQQFTCVATEPPNPMESACICNRTNCECCHPVKTFTKCQVSLRMYTYY